MDTTYDGKRTFFSRDFALALASYFLVFLSIGLFFIFPLFLDGFHPAKSRVGLIMGIHSVTSIMVRPLSGRILDKKGGRTVSIVGILLLIAATPGFHLVGSAGLFVILLRALSGAGWGIATTATLSMCSDLAPLDRIARSLGIIGLAGIVAGAIGPTLAEETMRRFGFGAVFNLSLILLCGALICVLATRRAVRFRENAEGHGMANLRKYPAAILFIIAAMPVLHGAARGTILNFIALFGKSLGFDRIGPFFLAFSVAAILTRFGGSGLSDRYGRKPIIFPAALIAVLNLFWIANTHTYGIFVLNGFISGLAQGLIFPPLSTYIIDFMGQGNKGLALGLYLSLFDVGMGLGSPLFGWISDIAGYRRMYAAAGLMLLVWTVVFSAKAPRVQPVTGSGQ